MKEEVGARIQETFMEIVVLNGMLKWVFECLG